VQRWGSEAASYLKALEKIDVSSQLVESNHQLQEQITENARLFQQTEMALAEQKRLSAELENQRAMLQAVLQSMPAGVFVAQAPTGKPLLSNKYAEEILGKGISPEASTEELAEIYAAYRYGSDELYPATEMPLVRGMFGETTSVNDMEIRRPDGLSMLLQVFGAPIYDTSSQITSSVAIFQDITERKRVEEANLERAQLNLFTAEISLALTQSATLRDMLQKCAEIMVQQLDAAFARIWTLNPAENVLELQASAGMYTHINGPHMRVPVGKFKIGLIAQERQAHLTNDILNDPRLGDKEWAEREGMIAFAGYPLIVGEHLVGVMAMFARRPLKEEVLQAMKSVANTVAISIDRKKFEQILTKRALELEAVAEVSTAISTILDTSTLLYQVTDLVKENFGLYHAHIYLLNEAGNTLDLAAGAGKVGRKMVKQGWNIPLAQENSLVAEAARARQAIVVNDVRQNPDYLPNPLLPETRSEMAVPLIVGDNVLGVLDVQANVINRFAEEDVPIKTTLAGQIAVALENARLFEKQQALTSESRHLLEQTQVRARREQILREVTARVRSSVDPDTIMRTAVQEVGKALGRPAFVYLGKGEEQPTREMDE
jgi:PAS domain S-box-containing protein